MTDRTTKTRHVRRTVKTSSDGMGTDGRDGGPDDRRFRSSGSTESRTTICERRSSSRNENGAGTRSLTKVEIRSMNCESVAGNGDSKEVPQRREARIGKVQTVWTNWA